MPWISKEGRAGKALSQPCKELHRHLSYIMNFGQIYVLVVWCNYVIILF